MDDRLRYKGFLLYGDLNLEFYSLGKTSLQRPVEMNLVGPFVFQQLRCVTTTAIGLPACVSFIAR
mgnify:FL=1|jgi:hypothetical protein